MSAPKFPAGPWTVCWTRLKGEPVGFHVTELIRGSGLPICEYQDPTFQTLTEAQCAAAVAIGALPEMYEALREARTAIAEQRQILIDSYSRSDGSIDPDGRARLDETDAVLAKIETALAKVDA